MFVGRLVAGLVGLAWNLVTFLTVPILISRISAVGAALKRSKDLFKKTWGENVVGQAGLGIVGFLAALPGVLLFVIGAALGTVGPRRLRRHRRGVDAREHDGRRRPERHLPHRALPLRVRPDRCRASSRASTSRPRSGRVGATGVPAARVRRRLRRLQPQHSAGRGRL